MATKTRYLQTPHHIGTVTAGGVTVENTGEAPEAVALSALGGRVNEYDDLATISGGILRQQYDGSSTLDLTEVRGPTTLTGTTSTGVPVTVQVDQMINKDGWAPGHSYMLETDSNGDLILEPGEYTRDIYMSAAPDALTAAAIGAMQNPPIAASAVTGSWLLARDYGKTPETKLATTVARSIITAMMAVSNTGPDKIWPSYQLYIENGYGYTGLIIDGQGQSPLHPNVIRAFGTGEPPRHVQLALAKAGGHSNHVFVGIAPDGGAHFNNFLIADVAQEGEEIGGNVTEQGSGYTLYRTYIARVSSSQPLNGSNAPTDNWREGRNIKAGIYLAKVFGVAFIDTIWDHNGHSDTAEIGPDGVPTGNWNNGQFGQPMTQFSHNVYTSEHNADMTWDGMINMRSASVGGQMRIGGWQYELTAIANRVAMQNAGAARADLQPEIANENGFHNLSIRVVGTNPSGLKSVVGYGGSRNKGLDFYGAHGVDVDCLAIHGRNPDDLENELILKPSLELAWNNTTTRYLWSNVSSYGWETDKLKNTRTEGLSEAFMKSITIQRWAAQKLGVPTASIADYGDYLATLTARERQLEIRALNHYMLSAIEPNLELPLTRTVPETVIFKPDWRGEGRLLDNPLNLSSKSRLIDGDSLDLNGNYARWRNWSKSLDHLTVGEGGLLDVNSGKLSFDSAEVGADVKVGHSGKLYFPAFDGNVTVRGGRFAVATASAGNVEASGQGQMIFGPAWTVRNGEKLRIVGDMGFVGWDSISGPGTLTIEAGGTLEFHATPVMHYAEYSFNEWHRLMGGFKGETSGATGEFDSWRWRNNRNSYVRIRDLVGTPVVGERTAAAKYLLPAGAKIATILPATIGKIEAGWKGRLGTANTTATFQVVLASGSTVAISNRDKLVAGQTYDLGGGAGTRVTYVNNGATLPAGVTVTNGKLQLVA